MSFHSNGLIIDHTSSAPFEKKPELVTFGGSISVTSGDVTKELSAISGLVYDVAGGGATLALTVPTAVPAGWKAKVVFHTGDLTGNLTFLHDPEGDGTAATVATVTTPAAGVGIDICYNGTTFFVSH